MTDTDSDLTGVRSARESGDRRALMSPQDALQPELVPPPPLARKRRPGVLAALSGFLTFLLVGLFFAGFGMVSIHRRIRDPGPLPADKVVYIAPGTDVPDIISLLETSGVISNPLLMSTALFVEGTRSKLRAGEYLFKQSASLQDVMDTMVSGRQVLHAFTVPEGLTSEQIVNRLRDNDVLSGDVREMPKEGTLLPDTYKVARSDTRSAVVRKMQEDQRKLVEQVWARRSPDLPIKTPFELVTLASIVERETGKADERPRVAGVFINRLNKRMRLQSDPTIVYGLVQGRGTLGRGILRSELDKWTPYNTYQIDGLPPGPIANPGRAALEAVANPSRTADLYFVADGTGGHVFAASLEEHQRNVVRWRQVEREAKERGAAAAADVDRAPAPNMALPSGAPSVPGAPTPRPGPRGDISPGTEFGALVQPTINSALPDTAPHLLPVAPPDNRLAGILNDPSRKRSITGIVEDRARTRTRANEPNAIVAVAPMRPEPRAPVTLAYGPDVDALGLQIRGVSTGPSLLDGPVGESGGVDMATYPVSAERRAEQRASAVKLGLTPESDQLPLQPPAELPPVTAYAPALRQSRAFDASEGTAIDPLRNRSWDLNHAQIVPATATMR